MKELWQRAQQGWPRRYVLVQFPNAPLLVYIAAYIAQLHTIATIALTIWALDEVIRGANLFRRALGAAILISIAIAV